MIETVLVVLVLLSLAIGLYTFTVVIKITKSVIWILNHVMVVGKKDQTDPDFTQIKKMFGIKDEKDPGK